MFTRQASQIQTALRGAFQDQGSAQDLAQALCNCAQTLEHRGPMQFTYQDPWSGLYPTIAPPPGQVEPYRPQTAPWFPPITPGSVSINMPAWQPMAWDNIPFVDVPEGSGPYSPYAPAPGQSASWNPLISQWAPGHPNQFAGGVQAGSVSAGQIDAGDAYTENIYNAGDTFVDGDTFVEGDTFVDGDMHVANNTFTGGPVTNNSTVTNNGPTFNGGPSYQFASSFNYGPTTFFGPVTFDNRITINRPLGGGPPILMAFMDQTVITKLEYVADKLVATRAKVKVLLPVVPQADDEILEVIVAGATFDTDTCEVRETVGIESPQLTFISEINALPAS